MNIDLLNELVAQAKEELQQLAATVEAAKQELNEHTASADLEQKEYDKIKSWADLYDTCNFAAKKIIILIIHQIGLCISRLHIGDRI